MDKNKSTDFEIRAYSKKELALCYFPDLDTKSAGKRLMRWITRNEELYSKLKKTGYNETFRSFSPRQVKLIVEILGDP